MFLTRDDEMSDIVVLLIALSTVAGVPSLIFSNGRDLLIGDIHGHSSRTLVHSRNRGVVVGVDFHFHLKRVFWTDTIQNKVILVFEFSNTWSNPHHEWFPLALLKESVHH